MLIEWPEEIDSGILMDIIVLRKLITDELAEIILDTVPAYQSLTVFFDTSKISYSAVVKKIKSIYQSSDKTIDLERRLWKIPVCYDQKFGIDLEEMAEKLNRDIGEIIRIHSAAVYDVYFFGFLPGFIYLGGLPEEIHYGRKAKPRQKIEKGAVGIADAQTGIYPVESPGGWNIIGNTPVYLFDVTQDPPCAIKPGDRIQFTSVDIKTYKEIQKQIKSGNYTIENESA